MSKNQNYYYDLKNDLEKYPDAWCYIIIGGRNTGKTYSSLKYCYKNKKYFTFIKRTIDDVDLLCAGSGKIGTKKNKYGVDLSPFKSLNRDLYLNVKAFSIFKGLGGFWKCDEEDIPEGQPIGYIAALNAVNKVKGFDLSECDFMIFDEFIPQQWERVNHKEGEQVMDMYKTISRDREHRGREPLKLVCLANATSAFNPVMEILEVTDDVVDMDRYNKSILYIEDRGILIHRINDNILFREKEKKSAIYKAMSGTAWGDMALNNNFGYDDFTSIKKISLKQYQPYIHVKYKSHNWYIYRKDGIYYCCTSKNNQYIKSYDLNKENDQRLFYDEEYFDFRRTCNEGNFLFQKYTMYRVLIRFKECFKV